MPVLKPQQVTNWIMWHPHRLHPTEKQQLDEALHCCPELATIRGLVHTFARMLCNLSGENLKEWRD
ncbi:hypothetical protein [Streptomyces sp. NPDC003006]